jgi:hypothetical protein
VPGQVRYGHTRKVVLSGADAVVFVADSRLGLLKENLVSLEDLRHNLRLNHLDPAVIPTVLQYNKQDLADLQPLSSLQKILNPEGRPSFTAVATRGEGVLATFRAAVEAMLRAIATRNNLASKGLDPASIQALVGSAFARYTAPPVEATSHTHLDPNRAVFVTASPGAGPQAPCGGSDALFDAEDLATSAIEASAGLAEVLGRAGRQLRLSAEALEAQARRLGPDHRPVREAIEEEARRLRGLFDEIGRHAPKDAAPAPKPATAVPELRAVVGRGVGDAQGALFAREVRVEVDVPGGLTLPRAAAPKVQRIVRVLLEGLSDESPPDARVLLKGESRLADAGNCGVPRRVLMLAAHHGCAFAEKDRQAIEAGQAGGPLGEAGRLARELGGSLRFGPVAGPVRQTILVVPVP